MLAFCIMDIHTAAKYMQHGYRVKRAGWQMIEYVYHTESGISGKIKDGGHMFVDFSLKDLLADDWELITEGIIKDFPITYSD